MDRLVRWGWELTGLNYRIIHISSEENVVADFLSRWGSGKRTEKARFAVLRDKPLASLGGDDTPAPVHAGSVGKACKGKLANTEQPSTLYEVPKPWQ